MRKKIVLITAGALIAISTTAFAANKREQFSISPVAGGITFDGKQHLQTRPVYGLRLGYNFTDAISVEGLFDYANTKGTITHKNVEFFRYGGDLLYHFMPDGKFVPYLAAGGAVINIKNDTATNSASRARGSVDYGAGVKYYITDNLALRGDVRHLIYRHGDTLHAVEYTMGLNIPLGGAVPAVKPVEPPPIPAKVEIPPPPGPVPVPAPAPIPAKVEVPPPPAPTSSLTISPAKITKGQLANLSWSSENTYNCDIQPGIGQVRLQGSMDVSPESDTIYIINCNGDGGSTSSKAGIAVVVPPAAVETVQPALVVNLCKPAVLGINFDTNKASIKPKYHDELKMVGNFLNEFPKAKGTIEGHTDNVGIKANNMKLSQQRADNVRDYLIKKFGVAPERIKAKGYGPTKPAASNKTEEGRAKNRRIEANFNCE